MPTYAYQAVDGTGKRTRGHAQAASTSALQRSLEERGLFVLDVAESTSDAVGGRRGGAWLATVHDRVRCRQGCAPSRGPPARKNGAGQALRGGLPRSLDYPPLDREVMQGCPRRRSVGACDGPADCRGGQPVFDAQPCVGGLFEPTSVPLQ